MITRLRSYASRCAGANLHSPRVAKPRDGRVWRKNVAFVQTVIASVTFWLAASHFVTFGVGVGPSVTFFHDHEV